MPSDELVPIDPSKFLPPDSDEVLTELDCAKKHQQEIIEQGMEALRELKDVAFSSQHPRAYEVLATMMKTVSEINKDLITTVEKKAEQKKPKDDMPSKVINNNTMNFIGTTAEIQDMIMNMKKKEIGNEDV